MLPISKTPSDPLLLVMCRHNKCCNNLTKQVNLKRTEELAILSTKKATVSAFSIKCRICTRWSYFKITEGTGETVRISKEERDLIRNNYRD